MLNQANAIGTAYLRAGLLKEPATTQIRDLLRRYTDQRIDLFEKGLDPEAVKQISNDMNAELNSLWAIIEETNQREPEIVRNSLIIPAANDVIDLSSTRDWAAQNRTPSSVLMLLGICMIASGWLTGIVWSGRSNR